MFHRAINKPKFVLKFKCGDIFDIVFDSTEEIFSKSKSKQIIELYIVHASIKNKEKQ